MIFCRREDISIAYSKNKSDERIDIERKEGVSLSFHNIHYEVKQKVDDVPLCGKVANKEILCGIRLVYYEHHRIVSN